MVFVICVVRVVRSQPPVPRVPPQLEVPVLSLAEVVINSYFDIHACLSECSCVWVCVCACALVCVNAGVCEHMFVCYGQCEK